MAHSPAAPTTAPASDHAAYARERFARVRAFSDHLRAPLAVEDYVVQTMPDMSPTKWHLAHTTWFFETFVLKPHAPGYTPLTDVFEYLFNSYYNAVGQQFPRPLRGHLSRPTVQDVLDYRAHVDAAMQTFFEAGGCEDPHIAELVVLGTHHEEQHQELIVTDLKHLFAQNPLFPAYRPAQPHGRGAAAALGWLPREEGIYEMGFRGEGFHFDNEEPRHRVFLNPFALADRLVTNGEFLQFIDDGGYRQSRYWLSEGWDAVQSDGWNAPAYWYQVDGGWKQQTLGGLRDLDLNEPVCHVSYYEADAYANWTGYRLPTEAEWEVVARDYPVAGNFVEDGYFHPIPADGESPQFFGDVWEWTRSPYVAYPGYRAAAGALGEYNGKFMCNQFVLRGGSCATAHEHTRVSYRNFFGPASRWQFAGLRLARDL